MESQFSPRKQPVQKRSKATVDAILDAAAQVLQKVGYAKTTTNAIATRAGVSIGSLYEYFPNKEAVFAALKEKLHRAQFEAVLGHLTIDDATPAARVIREILSARISTALEQPDVVSALNKEVPARVLQTQREADFDTFSEMMAAFATAHTDKIRIKNIETAIPLGIQMVDLTIGHLAAQRPEMLGDPKVLDELTDMMCRYILKDA